MSKSARTSEGLANVSATKQGRGLARSPGAPIQPSLVRAEPPLSLPDVVAVRMLRDDSGYTYHLRRPELVSPSAGDVLDVSANLADLWMARGACELAPAAPAAGVEAPANPPEELAAEEPSSSVPGADVKTPERLARKTRRGRKR